MIKEMTVVQKALFLVILCLAAYFRFIDLGGAALIDDEYYIARSIVYITSTGFPEFPNGGYYFRGVIQQYLTAAMMPEEGGREFALRLIPALCNLLCLPLVYLVTKRLANPAAALVAMSLFAFSLWEIEFARFARMYAPFQLLLLGYILLMLRSIQDNCKASLRAAYLLSVVGIFVYEAGAFLFVFNFIPWAMRTSFKFDERLLIPLAPIFVFVAVQLLVAVPVLTPPVELGAGGHQGMIVLPPFLILKAADSLLWLMLSLVMTCALLAAIWKTWAAKYTVILQPLMVTGAIIVAFLNQIQLSALILALSFVLPGAGFKEKVYEFRFALIYFFTISCFWLVYGLLNSDWYGVISTLDIENYPGRLAQLFGVLFNFPQVLPRYVMPMMHGMPLTTVAMFILMGVGFFLTLQRGSSKDWSYTYVLLIFVLSVLLVGTTGSFQKTSRYGFFIYPVMLILAVHGLYLVFRTLNILKPVFLGLSCIGLMLVLDDYRFKHLIGIGDIEQSYRLKMNKKEADHYLARRDFKSPVEFVNKHRKAGDVVISATTPSDFYLDQALDYMFIPTSANRYWERTVEVDGVTRDVWSDAVLIYDVDKHQSAFVPKDGNAVWLIAFKKGWNGKPDQTFDRFNDYHAYTSQDGTINVFKITR